MKYTLLFIVMMLSSGLIKAQKGNNQLKLMVEMGIAEQPNTIGPGLFLKGLYGLGTSSQFTLTSGFSMFQSESGIVGYRATITHLIPVLAGYKQNIHQFYIEPQLGFGELGGRIDIGGDYAKPSVGAFFWAIGGGYDMKQLNIGIRYQSAHGIESASAGDWSNKSFHYTGISVAYSIFYKK